MDLIPRGARYVITVHLTEEGNRFGLRSPHISRLAGLITDTADQPLAELNSEDLCAIDVELSEYVYRLHVARLPGYGEVNVIVPFSRRPRVDGKWIEEAVEAKAKYGRQTVANVTLIIGVLGLITPRQIVSFQETHPPEDLPFAEIWLVSPFDGVFCLKPDQR